MSRWEKLSIGTYDTGARHRPSELTQYFKRLHNKYLWKENLHHSSIFLKASLFFIVDAGEYEQQEIKVYHKYLVSNQYD